MEVGELCKELGIYLSWKAEDTVADGSMGEGRKGCERNETSEGDRSATRVNGFGPTLPKFLVTSLTNTTQHWQRQ
jgi:hypothetical protein